MANAFVYVDGFNLYYGAMKDTPYKWLNLQELCRRLLPHDNILAIKYFTARVSARPNDTGKPIRQEIYFRALRTLPTVQIFYGHFMTHSRRMSLTGVVPPKFVWVDRTEEKGSDVNLATHLLGDAFRNRFQLAVLVTNDSDLAEPVRMVRQELGLCVGILNPHPTHSRVLSPLVTFKKRIRQSDLLASQFPDPMADAVGQFNKPPGW